MANIRLFDGAAKGYEPIFIPVDNSTYRSHNRLTEAMIRKKSIQEKISELTGKPEPLKEEVKVIPLKEQFIEFVLNTNQRLVEPIDL
jgi:hypothetical protein